MILIADSGSTKTDWVLRPAADTVVQAPAAHFQTQGLNPIHLSDEQIGAVLCSVRQWLSSHLQRLTPSGISAGSPLSVLFYGSGVRPDQEVRMERLIREALSPLTPHQERAASLVESCRGLLIEAHSDLLGAARALCGESEGLACILGTGANSCLYDGHNIVANTPPLGYILGDEGSGAVLGKRFLNALYKGHLGEGIKADFEADMQMTLTEVIDRVYRQPLPNRWLASLSPFIHGRLAVHAVEELVVENFSAFIARNIEPYHRRDLPLQAVGSIAFYYRDQLCQAARKAGYAVGKILRSPLELPGTC